jgi:hypothetical protein
VAALPVTGGGDLQRVRVDREDGVDLRVQRPDPGQQLGPDLDRVARNAALKRIVAQSAYGIVIGGGGGAVFGGAVLPAVEDPHDGLDLEPPSPDFTDATVTLY